MCIDVHVRCSANGVWQRKRLANRKLCPTAGMRTSIIKARRNECGRVPMSSSCSASALDFVVTELLSDKHRCKRMRLVALRSLAFRKIVCNYHHFLLFVFMSDISCGTVVNLLMTRAGTRMDIW